MSDKHAIAEKRYRKMKLKPKPGSSKNHGHKSKTFHPKRTLRHRNKCEGPDENGLRYWIFPGTYGYGYSGGHKPMKY